MVLVTVGAHWDQYAIQYFDPINALSVLIPVRPLAPLQYLASSEHNDINILVYRDVTLK